MTPAGVVTRGTTVFADAAIDASGKVIALSGQAIHRYAADITTLDGGYVAGTLPTSLGTLAILTLLGDELFVTGTTRKTGESFSSGTTVLARYAATGGLDADFGALGVATGVPGDLTMARPVRSSDGRIYVSGSNETGSIVVRYWL